MLLLLLIAVDLCVRFFPFFFVVVVLYSSTRLQWVGRPFLMACWAHNYATNFIHLLLVPLHSMCAKICCKWHCFRTIEENSNKAPLLIWTNETNRTTTKKKKLVQFTCALCVRRSAKPINNKRKLNALKWVINWQNNRMCYSFVCHCCHRWCRVFFLFGSKNTSRMTSAFEVFPTWQLF